MPTSDQPPALADDNPFADADDPFGPNLAVLLTLAAETFRTKVLTTLAEHGHSDLRSNDIVLLRLAATGRPTITELAELFGVTKQAMSQVVDSLATRGYVERVRDPRDGRRVRLTLSPRGRQALTVAGTARVTEERRVAAALGPDTAAFLRGLRLLTDETSPTWLRMLGQLPE
ncbi:MarR family winged helix-turn-helix transcriptional regulator [Actinophytocola glycyrrhizae]|uniref:MarR family winged helix-turn-helix transcriptional regulator n=1 Tax=Actinophytocola glycyrrhizae TaxID=2044873 RepID=A0ABV9RUC7_9PSEU